MGTWGVRGALKVERLTEFTERFHPGSILYLNGQPTRVENSRTNKGNLIVKFDMVSNQLEAKLLNKQFITIPQEEAKPLPEGSYYHFQILDLDVWSDEDEYLGRVKEILSTGGNDVYVVSCADRKDILIPALLEVILNVDLQTNRMTLRLPQGIR